MPVTAAPYITICPRNIKFKYLEEREKSVTNFLNSNHSIVCINQCLPFKWILSLFLLVFSRFFKKSHDWISFVCTAREWSNPTWRRPGHVTTVRWRRCVLPGLVSTNESTVPGDLGPGTNQRPESKLAENALSGLFPVPLLRLPVRDRALGRSWTGSGPDTTETEITPRAPRAGVQNRSEEEWCLRVPDMFPRGQHHGVLMTHLIPSRQFLLAPSEARCSLCRLYSASYSARAWPGGLTCDFSSLEPTFRSFLKRFSNTEADEMILIIHPRVGLHEVRNVSVIFLSSSKYFIVCEKRRIFLWLIHFSTGLWNVQRSDVSNQERKFDHQVHSVSGQI